jgi:hypothetical protein
MGEEVRRFPRKAVWGLMKFVGRAYKALESNEFKILAASQFLRGNRIDRTHTEIDGLNSTSCLDFLGGLKSEVVRRETGKE